MKIIETPDEMRAWSREQRCAKRSIGFVPTMGALHEGHASLLKASVKDNDATVLSVFVNPTQFAPNEDYSQYPRTFETDCELARTIGADVVYAPDRATMYPPDYTTYVDVEGVTELLCGKSRPHFFRGVATIVTKLFHAVQPDRAYFGQKDAQQAAMIRRMTADLDFGIEIVEMPIVREADGLAMSSRNAYMNADERQRALALHRGLERGRALMEAGERDPAKVVAAVREELRDVDIDYVELVDADTIQPVQRIAGTVLLAVAAKVGPPRLIDNLKFTAPEEAPARSAKE